MKKLFKWIVRIVITLVLLVVIAAFVLPMVFDPNDHKDFIEDKIAAQIGRPAHLNGEIKWKVFPWLALTFNDVTVANAEGFKGDTLADIQTLSARIKIMPLLSKNIEVGKVVIDDAQFNLQVANSGESNWQSIVSNLAGDDATTDKQAGSSKLAIAGVELSNININYTDAQTKTTAKITDFNLSTGKINRSSPVNFATSLHLNMPDTGLDVAIEADIVAKNLLKDAGIIAEINNFTIKGKMSTQSVMPLEVSLPQAGTIDLGSDTLTFPKVLVALGAAKITTNLQGNDISKENMQLSGTYDIGSFDLNEFLKKLTGAYFVTNDTFSAFSSSGAWSTSGSSLNLANLKINFADTIVTGDANIQDLDKMSGNFKLNFNKLNIDDFLGDEETASGGTSGSNQTPNIDFGRLRGSINIDKLLASGTTVENLQITVNTNGSKMILSPIKADFYQGLLVTAIKIDTNASKNKVIVEHNMDKIHAGPLLVDLAGSQLLTGIGDLDVKLNIDKPFSDVPLKTAHGNINYTLKDGAIYGVDVFGMMQKGLSLLYPEVNAAGTNKDKKTSFALMQINADINQGVLTTNTFKIESPFLHVAGDLTIDLVNMTIAGTLEPMLLDIPEQLVSDKYNKLLNLPIPVTLSGSLFEPKISIDAKKLLLATQKERIDKEKDKLKGKLLDSLFGKDKKKSKDKQKTDAQGDDGDDENQEPKKKQSSKDKLKKDLLKGLLGGS